MKLSEILREWMDAAKSNANGKKVARHVFERDETSDGVTLTFKLELRHTLPEKSLEEQLGEVLSSYESKLRKRHGGNSQSVETSADVKLDPHQAGN